MNWTSDDRLTVINRISSSIIKDMQNGLPNLRSLYERMMLIYQLTVCDSDLLARNSDKFAEWVDQE